MKKLFVLLSLSALFIACNGDNDKEKTQEPQELVVGDPGTTYDNVSITTLEDRVAYSVGYNSTEDAREWLNSREFHPFLQSR